MKCGFTASLPLCADWNATTTVKLRGQLFIWIIRISDLGQGVRLAYVLSDMNIGYILADNKADKLQDKKSYIFF